MSDTLLSSIQEEVKTALKSGEKFRASTLRLIVSALKLEEKNKAKALTDKEALEILTKMIKQRKDSISQFETANRMELAQKEKDEIEIIQNYLPEQLSEEELSVLINEVMRHKGKLDLMINYTSGKRIKYLNILFLVQLL